MSFCNVFTLKAILVKEHFDEIDVIKLFSGGNLDFPKLRNWIKFVVVTEPAQKC